MDGGEGCQDAQCRSELRYGTANHHVRNTRDKLTGAVLSRAPVKKMNDAKFRENTGQGTVAWMPPEDPAPPHMPGLAGAEEAQDGWAPRPVSGRRPAVPSFLWPDHAGWVCGLRQTENRRTTQTDA